MESNPLSCSGANTKQLNVATSNFRFDSESDTELRITTKDGFHSQTALMFTLSSCEVYLAHVSGSEEEIQCVFLVHSFPQPLVCAC